MRACFDILCNTHNNNDNHNDNQSDRSICIAYATLSPTQGAHGLR